MKIPILGALRKKVLHRLVILFFADDILILLAFLITGSSFGVSFWMSMLISTIIGVIVVLIATKPFRKGNENAGQYSKNK